jgi:3-polyprenyl-4-hydroxybenzoate decarboxylase
MTKGPVDDLDDAAELPAYGGKMGIDATRKANYPEEIRVPGSDEIKLEDYFPGWRSTK